MRGKYAPVGRLPITMPRGDEVLAVNADGVRISPNDVPGYDKDQYMPDALVGKKIWEAQPNASEAKMDELMKKLWGR